MEVKLYEMTCDSYVVDKSSYLSNAKTFNNVYFKEGIQDLKNPSLIIKVPEDFNDFNFNYLELNIRPGVDDLIKYYYITRLVLIDSLRIMVDLKEDVLYTFKDKILASDAYVKRSYSDGRLDLFDDKITFEYKPISDIHSNVIPITMKNTCINYASSLYIMIAFLNDDPNGANIGTNEVPVGYSSIIKNNNYKECGYDCTTSYRLISYSDLNVLLRVVYNNDTLLKFIKGIYTFPFEIDIDGATTTFNGKYPVFIKSTSLRIGSTVITVDNYQPKLFLHKFPIYNQDTPFTDDSFDKYEPNLKYSWWIDYFGWKEIPYKYLYDKELLIYYDINLETGDASVIIESDSNLISIDPVMLCTKIPLSSTNALEATNQRNANFQSTTISTITSALTFAGGIATMNPVLLAGGAVSLGSSVISGINKNTQIYDIASAVATSSNVSTTLSKLTKYETYKIDGTLPLAIDTSRVGLPLNEYRTLNTISGYTEAIDLRLSDNTGVLDNELEEIKKIVANGIII